MMMNPLKLGIAIACLVGVAALIAMDLRRDSGDPVPAAPARPEPVPVAVPIALPRETAVQPVPAAAPQPETAKAVPPTKPEKSESKEAVAKVPAAEAPKPASLEKAVPPPPARLGTYTVMQGDTLYGISVKVFGTPRHYERIYEENRDRIADPNTLQIGLNLKLPDVPAKAGSRSPEAAAPAAEAPPGDLR
ncbi:MAG: LysM peptidoglycan-binding domain-containing protein [Planctomycetaceae bacterium]|nr:LysM peptidoglycan-binding domain-containing protein [Planctomycetaceae bacterium]